jgi:hypothetical protein
MLHAPVSLRSTADVRFAIVVRMLRPYIAIALLASCATAQRAGAPDTMQAAEFRALLDRLAIGWNSGDARAAAECFTDDAVYTEPPRKQLYIGRAALYKFFGGDSGRAGEMQMRWNTIVFDPAQQRGMGEFTFRYGTQVHGVAVIDVASGRIAQWREYWYESEKPFEQFVEPSRP